MYLPILQRAERVATLENDRFNPNFLFLILSSFFLVLSSPLLLDDLLHLGAVI
jgi:hypothetical protein